MLPIRTVTLLATLAVAGCASSPTPPPAPVAAAHWLEPAEAIVAAAAAPRLGVKGLFVMTVQATGRTDRVHLNSERDYRDQRNLSVTILPEAAKAFEVAYGAPPEVAFKGKRILVAGTARRVRIDFIANGRPSGKYYYQTHVFVQDTSQIRVL